MVAGSISSALCQTDSVPVAELDQIKGHDHPLLAYAGTSIAAQSVGQP